MPWPRALTLVAPALAVPLIALGVIGIARSPDPASIVAVTVGAVLGTLILTCAWAVSRRLPGNAVAPVLAWMGLVIVAHTCSDSYSAAAVLGSANTAGTVDAASLGPVFRALTALTAGSWTWWFVPIGMLLAIFPDGRVANRLGAVTLIGLPSVAAAFQLLGAFAAPTLMPPLEGAPNPLPYVPILRFAVFPLLGALLGLLVTAVVSAAQRYRHGGTLVRAQLRWLRLGGIALPLTLLLCWLSYLLLDGPDLVGLGLVLLYVGIPAVSAVALLRHERYDVDDAVASAASYTAMVVVLLGAFSIASVGSGLLIGRESFPLAVTVTALVAFTLGAGRRRIQAAIGRMLFPVRVRALRAIADLHQRIEAGHGEPEEITTVLAAVLRDPDLAIVEGAEPPGDAGAPGVGGPATPVALGGITIAHLVPGRSTTRRVPRDVADAAALLIETVRLRRALTAATSEIEASRERLLLAGYDERRRLERDLHDGAQQRLVSLGMSLRLIQRALPDETRRLAEDLDRAVAEIGTTVAELRLLAQGLRPSSLDDGLRSALAYLAHTCAVPLELQVSELDLPDQISTTAYFVVSEAVTNAIKHADAGRITVRVHSDGEGICVVVTDDGRGGARPRPGSGLTGLTDRVAAVGGRLYVDSTAGSGTTVKVLLPCGS